MIVTPVIFCTIVSGIAHMGDHKKVGKVAIKSLVYFEVVTTIALAIGLCVVNLIQPGKGLNILPSSLDIKNVESYLPKTGQAGTREFMLNIIPSGFLSGFVNGEILQVLFVSILFGIALSSFKSPSNIILKAVDSLLELFFKVVATIMKFAPIGAFGAMAFTTSKFGFETLHALLNLMACVYITCILFILFVLGGILKFAGFNILKLLVYIKDEIFLVFATSSSEAALPKLIKKMEDAGCSKSITGLVIPTGYSFNLDGTSIYLTMAAIFIAQATNTPLTLIQELALLGILMIASKGAAAVTGGGFVTLAAALSAFDLIPVAGISLLLGIDRFMSEARAITNLIGNSVATLFISNSENELDKSIADKFLR